MEHKLHLVREKVIPFFSFSDGINKDILEEDIFSTIV